MHNPRNTCYNTKYCIANARVVTIVYSDNTGYSVQSHRFQLRRQWTSQRLSRQSDDRGHRLRTNPDPMDHSGTFYTSREAHR